jgi:hypothetical protein
VVVADLDDDKDLDVIVGDIGNSRRLTVLENIFREADEPEDPFLEISSTPQVPEGSPVSVVLADADSDGDLDFFTGNGFIDGGSASSVSVFLNNGNGTFQLPKSAGRNLGSLSIVVGDTDGDDTPDVVSVGDTLTAVLLGDGQGELFEPLTQTVGQGPVAAVFGNFDNDDTLDADENEDNRLGTTDIVVLNATDNTISILLNQRDGRFDIDREDGTVAVGDVPRQMALGLLDSDDDDDLIVTNSGDQSVTVLRGAANGTFSQRQDFAVGTDVDGVATGDVNGDGFVDVVVGNRDSSSVSVLLGNGNGGLAAPVTFATGMAPAQVAVVDVNGDGRLDVVTLNLESDTVSVLLQTLEGGLAAAINTPVDEFAVQLLLVDLNNDTKPDLVTADSQSQQIAVFGGNGDGTFVDPVLIEMVGLPIDVKAGDLNGDNKPDLAVLTSASNAPILFNNGSLQLQVDQTLQMAPDGAAALYIADALPDADFGIFDNNDSLEFRDDDGTLIKVSLSGPGEGRVTQDAFGRILINIEGTSGQSKLNIASQRGGNGVANLHDIIVAGGGLGQIDGKGADLTGTLRVLDGGVNKITLRNVEAERGIQIGAGDNANQTLDLTFNHVKNTSIQSALPIKSIKVSSWLDPNAQSQPDAIVAPWVGTVKAGDFDAGFTLSGVDAPRGLALNSVKARDIKAGIYQIAQGDIGSIKAESIAQAIADDVADGFTESVRFNVAGAIKKLDVKGNAAFDLLAQRAETISVKGDLINSRIRLTLVTEGDEQARALKSLKVGGLVEELLLDSAGSIDTIDVDLIRESRVFLGVTPLQPGQSFPSVDADPFNHDATLRQFKTKRQKDGPDPDDDDEPSFEDTVVAARNIGKLDLQLVKLDNNNTKFGVAADRIDALNFGDSEDDRVRYQLKDLDTAQDVLDQLDNPAALDDFEIRLF